MTVLSIVLTPQPLLRDRSTPIEKIDDDVRALAADMLDTMYSSRGVGLAAIQVGIPKRLVVVDVAKPDEEKVPWVLVNPEILTASEHRTSFREGCLSIPGVMAEIDRPSEIMVRYTDLDGVSHVLAADGVLATCLQHEIDHLNGVLFIDYLDTD